MLLHVSARGDHYRATISEPFHFVDHLFGLTHSCGHLPSLPWLLNLPIAITELVPALECILLAGHPFDFFLDAAHIVTR